MSTTHEPAPALRAPLIDLLLAAADDKFFLGHRDADWTGLAPILEEDIAFSSLAQDNLAHALALYELIASTQGGRADDIAYGRSPGEYRSAWIVEIADDFDWALAVGRQFFCDHFEQIRLGRMTRSNWPPLAHLASRLLAEESLAIGHADQWIVRLGQGGDAARRRTQAAITRLAPLAVQLFEPTANVQSLESAGLYPRGDGDDFDRWRDAVQNVLSEATIAANLDRPTFDTPGGRRGARSPGFDAMHAELTEVYRVEPKATW